MSENNNEGYITQEEANERMRKFAMHTIEAVEENSLMAPVALKLLSALERSMQKMVEPPPPTYQQLQAMVAVLRSNLAIEQDKQSALEAKCAALAAENAALNEKMNKLATWPGIEFYSSAWEFNSGDGDDALEFMCDAETPATDSFLAEVRAQGVDMAIKAAMPEVASEFQRETFEQCVSATVRYPQSDLAGKVEMVAWLELFAAQLRQDANTAELEAAGIITKVGE